MTTVSRISRTVLGVRRVEQELRDEGYVNINSTCKSRRPMKWVITGEKQDYESSEEIKRDHRDDEDLDEERREREV